MLGLVSISFRELDYKQLVDICVKDGIQAIEWGADVHVPPNDLEHAKKVRAYCDEHHIVCPTYGSYYHIGVPDHVGNTHPFSDLIATAKILGAKTIRIWPSKTASSDATPAFLAQCVAELKELCALAAKDDINVAMEYHWNTLTDTAESTLNIIKATESSHMKTFWQMNYERTPEEHLKELQLLEGHIANIHCYFWEGRTRLPLKEGETAWKSYIAQLKSQNIPFMLEHLKDDSLVQLAEDAAVLKQWLEEANL